MIELRLNNSNVHFPQIGIVGRYGRKQIGVGQQDAIGRLAKPGPDTKSRSITGLIGPKRSDEIDDQGCEVAARKPTAHRQLSRSRQVGRGRDLMEQVTQVLWDGHGFERTDARAAGVPPRNPDP
jgi:hypothetical protein